MQQRSIEVGVLGATGVVGQHFVSRLSRHPWFKPVWLAASERSEGKAYRDAAPWRLAAPMPAGAADLTVDACVPGRAPQIVFSGLDASVAGDVEGAFAAAGHIVVSNARNFRMDPLVPLLIPEVNADHLSVLAEQRRVKGWTGAIVTNPNCSTIVLASALAPLAPVRRHPGGGEHDAGGVGRRLSRRGRRSTSSATSCPSSAARKRRWRPRRRRFSAPTAAASRTRCAISAHTNRVPVLDGHTITVSVEFESPAGDCRHRGGDARLHGPAAGAGAAERAGARHRGDDRTRPSAAAARRRIAATA